MESWIMVMPTQMTRKPMTRDTVWTGGAVRPRQSTLVVTTEKNVTGRRISKEGMGKERETHA